ASLPFGPAADMAFQLHPITRLHSEECGYLGDVVQDPDILGPWRSQAKRPPTSHLGSCSSSEAKRKLVFAVASSPQSRRDKKNTRRNNHVNTDSGGFQERHVPGI